MDIETLKTLIRNQADKAGSALNDETAAVLALEDLLRELARLVGPAPTKARVILFKPTGKYYTEEEWIIPTAVPAWSSARGDFTRQAVGPFDMEYSPDFRRINMGPVLVPEQEPWGYPFLFV